VRIAQQGSSTLFSISYTFTEEHKNRLTTVLTNMARRLSSERRRSGAKEHRRFSTLAPYPALPTLFESHENTQDSHTVGGTQDYSIPDPLGEYEVELQRQIDATPNSHADRTVKFEEFFKDALISLERQQELDEAGEEPFKYEELNSSHRERLRRPAPTTYCGRARPRPVRCHCHLR
jgi:hypothetical protein